MYNPAILAFAAPELLAEVGVYQCRHMQTREGVLTYTLCGRFLRVPSDMRGTHVVKSLSLTGFYATFQEQYEILVWLARPAAICRLGNLQGGIKCYERQQEEAALFLNTPVPVLYANYLQHGVSPEMQLRGSSLGCFRSGCGWAVAVAETTPNNKKPLMLHAHIRKVWHGGND